MVLEFGDGWLLDSLVAEGGVKLSWIYIGVVTEIRRAKSSNNQWRLRVGARGARAPPTF